MAFQIKRAERSQAKARLGLCGPSGSGKTMSALRIAAGMVRKLGREGDENAIGVIDSERNSASLYADTVPFVTLGLEPPYTPESYAEAIEALEKHGCEVIIIDQISHAWSGPGGVLEFVDDLKASNPRGNNMQPWAKATPKQNAFVDAMLRSKAHLIATMRSKTEWVMDEEIVKGFKKTVPRKIGLAPIQRDQIEYEFTTFLNIDPESHYATASKNRCPLFKTQTLLDESTGEKLAEWLLSGAPVAESKFEVAKAGPSGERVPEPLPPKPATKDPALAILETPPPPPKNRWERCPPRLLAAVKERASTFGRDKQQRAGSIIGDAIEATFGPLEKIADGDPIEGAIELAMECEVNL